MQGIAQAEQECLNREVNASLDANTKLAYPCPDSPDGQHWFVGVRCRVCGMSGYDDEWLRTSEEIHGVTADMHGICSTGNRLRELADVIVVGELTIEARILLAGEIREIADWCDSAEEDALGDDL